MLGYLKQKKANVLNRVWLKIVTNVTSTIILFALLAKMDMLLTKITQYVKIIQLANSSFKQKLN